MMFDDITAGFTFVRSTQGDTYKVQQFIHEDSACHI